MGDFIERYIFPGGQRVHVSVAMDAMARGGLEPLDAKCLRPHYARTLWHWADALEAHLDEARHILRDGAKKSSARMCMRSAQPMSQGVQQRRKSINKTD